MMEGQADVILANSRFTSRVFKSYFPSIAQDPYVVYPGINLSAYESKPDASDPDIEQLLSRVFSHIYLEDIVMNFPQ